MNTLFSHLALEESFLLGWTVADTFVRLHLELIVLPGHSMFTPFDASKLAACYRLATITLYGVFEVGGIEGVAAPVWDPALGEFRDLHEVNACTLSEGVLRLICDDLDISVAYRTAEVHLHAEGSMDVFTTC